MLRLCLLLLLAGCAAHRRPARMPDAEPGRISFQSYCAACHQYDGQGMGDAPPLAGSPWVTGPEDRLIRIVLHGLRGRLEGYGKTYVIDEANLADPVPAIHGVRKDASLAHILDLPDHAIRGRIKDRQHLSGTEIHPSAVETHDAVVGLRPDLDALYELAVVGVDDQITAILPRIPPAGGNIELLAIHCDRRSIAAGVIGLFPDDLLGL